MINVFFELVRSGLYGTQYNISNPISKSDWKKIFELSQKQTLQGVVADAILRLPCEVKVPDDIKRNFTDAAFTIARSHSKLNNVAAKIVKFYRDQGISTILLKGQGIADCYRNPIMRQCGDIDLYVGTNNYEKACQIAKENSESGITISEESIKHIHLSLDNIAIDLHRIAAVPITFLHKDFQKWLAYELEKESTLRKINLEGEQINLPPIFFDAFFIFYHAWYHLVYEGVGLRQLCDWTMFLNKYYKEIDLLSLEDVLTHFHLMRPWQLFGYIAVNQLGLPKDKMPFYNPSIEKKSKKILELILEGGNFGFFSKGKHPNINKKPFLKRNYLKLRKAARWYTTLSPIIPLEASLYFINRIYLGSSIAFKQLFHH